VFAIDSITKTFTSLLLMDMVQRGEVALYTSTTQRRGSMSFCRRISYPATSVSDTSTPTWVLAYSVMRSRGELGWITPR
jgi:hypothetical protein